MSPIFFWTGRQPRLPAAVSLPDSSLDPKSSEFVTSFQNRIQNALDVGRLSQIKLIKKMDTRRNSRQRLVVGDWAYLDAEHTPIPGDNHFRVKWAGPFPVKAVTPSTATLDLPEHWQLASNQFHVDKLKKFIPREGDSAPPPKPRCFRNRPIADLGEIIRISRHQRVGRKLADGRRSRLQYFVHWKGLPIAYGEWLDEATILQLPNAEHHIQAYLRVVNVADP